MGQPIVHFEIIGKDPEKLRSYYGALFGWEFDTNAPVAEAISQPGNCGFVDRNTTSDGTGIPGGVGSVPMEHLLLVGRRISFEPKFRNLESSSSLSSCSSSVHWCGVASIWRTGAKLGT